MSAAANTAVPVIDAEHPWPGLLPFPEEARAYFHGRDREAEELVRLIGYEPLTVLFGQSGLGKSSLLRAGVSPRLRRAGLLPVYLRLDLDPQADSLSAQVLRTLMEQCALHDVTCREPQPGVSLWEYLHLNEVEFVSPHGRPVAPVLIFDQFEEIFTLGRQDQASRAHSQDFLRELGDLAENRAPAEFEARVEADPDILDGYDLYKHTAKIVLSFREDYLAEFEELKKLIRPIMNNRMRLNPMDGEQAVQALLLAGGDKVSRAVAERIVCFVGKGKSLGGLRVEPALLSLVCCELNERRIARGEAQISTDLLAGDTADLIIENFYRQCFDGLDERVRIFVEGRLLTTAGFRNSCAMDDALDAPGVTDTALQTLVNRRLLRREERAGLVWLELTHDVLTGVARASRDARQQAEKLAEARRQLLKQRRRQKIMAVAGLCLTGLLLVVGWSAWRASVAEQNAKENLVQAESAKAAAKLQLAQQFRFKGRDALAAGKVYQANAYLALAYFHAKSDPVTAMLLREAERRLSADAGHIAAHAKEISDMDLDASETWLATLSEGSVKLWRIEGQTGSRTLRLTSVIRDQRAAITLIRFDPSGRRLIAFNENGHGSVYELDGIDAVQPPAPRALQSDNLSRINAVAFGPDALLATAGSDGVLRVIDLDQGAQIDSVGQRRDPALMAVAFAGPGRIVAGSEDGTAAIFPLQARKLGQPEHRVKTGAPVRTLALAREANQVAIGASNGAIVVLDLGTGTTRQLGGEGFAVTALAYDPAGGQLASADAGGSIRLWPIGREGAARVLRQGGTIDVAGSSHTGALFVRFTEGRTVSAVFADGGLRQWTEDGALLTDFAGRGSPVLATGMATDGRLLAVGTGDGMAQLWFTGSVGRVAAHSQSGRIRSIAFDRNGEHAVTASQDGTAAIWRTDRLVGETIIRHAAPGDWVLNAQFSPDDKTLMTVGGRELRLWARPAAGWAKAGTDAGPARTIAPSDGRRFGQGLFVGEAGKLLTAQRETDVDDRTGQTLTVWNPDGTIQGEVPIGFIRTSVLAAGANGRLAMTRSSDFRAGAYLVNSHRYVEWPNISAVAIMNAHPQFAVGGVTGRVRIFRVPQNLALEPPAHSGRVTALAFSPDDSLLASAGGDDNAVHVYSTIAETLLTTFTEAAEIQSLAISPDNRKVLILNGAGRAALWDARTGDRLAPLSAPSPLSQVAFSPDGAKVMGGSEDGTVTLWTTDAETGDPVEVARRIAAKLPAEDLSLREATAALAEILDTGRNELARGFEAATRNQPNQAAKLLLPAFSAGRTDQLGLVTADLRSRFAGLDRVIDAHAERVETLRFALNGTRLITGSFDRTARVWDVSTGRLLYTFPGFDELVVNIATQPKGKLAIIQALSSPEARVFDIERGTELGQLKAHAQINRIALSRDGRFAFTALVDGTLISWDLSESPIRQSASLRLPGRLNDLFALGDGRYVARIGSTMHVLERSANGLTGLGLEIKTDSAITDMHVHPTKPLAVTLGDDGHLRLWDLSTGKQHREAVFEGASEVTFSPSGDQIGITGENGAGVWPLDMAKPVALPGTEKVWSATFDDRGRYLAAVSLSGTVKLWDTATRIQLGSLDGHDSDYVAMDNQGELLATGTNDGKVHLWTIREAKPRTRTLGGNNAIIQSAPAPDMILVRERAALIVRKAATAKEIDRVPLAADDSRAFRLSADGRSLAALLPSGRVDIIRLADKVVTQTIETGIAGWKIEDSPSRRTLLLWNGKGQAATLDLATLAVTPWGEAPGNTVLAMKFGGDDSSVASLGADGRVDLWDVAGVRQGGFPVDSASKDLRFHAATGRVLTLGQPGASALWSARDGSRLALLNNEAIADALFFGDGEVVAVLERSGRQITLHDAADGRQRARLDSGAEIFAAIRASDDGRMMLTADQGGDVRLWNAAGTAILGVPAQRGAVGALALTRDRTLIYGSGGDIRALPLGRAPSPAETATLARRLGIALPQERW